MPLVPLPLQVTLSLSFALWEGVSKSHCSLFLGQLPVRGPSSLAAAAPQTTGHGQHPAASTSLPLSPQERPLKAVQWGATLPGWQGPCWQAWDPQLLEKDPRQPPCCGRWTRAQTFLFQSSSVSGGNSEPPFMSRVT